MVLPAATISNFSLASLQYGRAIQQQQQHVVHISPSPILRWLQVRGSRLQEKLQNRRDSEAQETICCRWSSSRAPWHRPHCPTSSTWRLRFQQIIASSGGSGWLGSSSVMPNRQGFTSGGCDLNTLIEPVPPSLSDWRSNERLFENCERGKILKVAVLVSGGVDSSVALRLLREAGHDCTAFYLKIWFQEDFENFWSECPWEEDLEYAQAVCNEVGVELRVVHLTDEYWKLVVSHSISEIRAGQTPNPDILCNSRIKFGAFLENLQDAQFDRIASGHYARVERALSNGDSAGARLLLSADQVKDQTYFLSHLTQAQLSRLMFPLGGLTKAEVRQLAEAMGLSNKHRKDSQGICFLGKVKFNEFIAKHLGEQEGRLIEAETGELLGLHKGFWFYTIGQRHGLYLSNGPWFVVAKDVENNVVFISRKYYSEDKRRRAFRVASFCWFSGYPLTNTARLQCKVRHGPRSHDCILEFEYPECRDGDVLVPNNARTAIVTLSEDDQGLAPGQYAAFYQQEVCLGSAVITEALGASDYASVSEQAFEVARQPFDIEVYRSSKPKLSSSLRGNETNNRVKQSCASN